MKNVDEMSLDQRIMELQQSVSKARVGAENPGSVEYEFLLNSKLSYYESILSKASDWKRGKFDSLDYDVKQQTITDINNKLIDALVTFPGYGRTQELEQPQGLGR